jgi:glycosyltransferase involved in cell wall biosynthesis
MDRDHIEQRDPKVTVLMSVYNGERYLNEAVDSILAQTFTDFEFLIIDDASTDLTPEILRSYDDPRIRIVTNEENLGLTKSLNKGIALARGEYIARMDADDVSFIVRLERQVEFMEKNADIGVLGSNYQYIDESGYPKGVVSTSLDPELTRWELLFLNPLAHPTVLMRTALMRSVQGYDETFRFSQDYELWCRLTKITQLAKLQDVLLYLRSSKLNISHRHYKQQRIYSHLITLQVLQNILHNKEEGNISDNQHHKSIDEYWFLRDIDALITTI